MSDTPTILSYGRTVLRDAPGGPPGLESLRDGRITAGPPASQDPHAPFVVSSPAPMLERPRVGGKFLFAGNEKLWVRGVTYGTFRPNSDGHQFPAPEVVEHDFAAMVENGINAVRTYTVPPRWLLDAAARHGLRIMIGLSWEDHIAFLEERTLPRAIARRLAGNINTCAGHPAILCYAIANEIPAPIVRWHGPSRIERFLHELYEVAKGEDPGALVTYVNFPTTEYLRLPFLDIVSFNVYLEDRERLAAYLRRIQNLVDDRPLLMAEIGLDSRRHGDTKQAEVLDWQIRTSFAAGCGGMFVFAWTDEWYRGGADIEDWDFGLTTRRRGPKPSLLAVSKAYAEAPFGGVERWPAVSVVVCTYNGARTILDTLEALQRVDYPNYEVIVVNDGSTDTTAEIVRNYDAQLISTENRGLSAARNTGMKAAAGEIVAYLDDDAYPDPHWLRYLALAFTSTDHVGVGGPNLAPPGDGSVAECVANAPGGPTHVLLSDDLAEHIPGCNMAFRRSALLAVGGFDPQFRATADDVDICWRLRDCGWTLGFSAAAMVWHHRRNSVRLYWRQQKGYGKGEALLEQKWPARYSALGHLTWSGRIYGKGLTKAVTGRRVRIYQGIWGSAPFQSLYQPTPGLWTSLPLMPEWYFVIALLAVLSGLGVLWAPMFLLLVLLAVAVAALLVQAGLSAAKANFQSGPLPPTELYKLRLLTAVLHLLQPLARITGRLCHGLTPWRRRGASHVRFPRPYRFVSWEEQWQTTVQRLADLEARLRQTGAAYYHGGEFDDWDLEVRAGLFGAVRGLIAVEEHGAGRQLVRLRIWPRVSVLGWGLTGSFAALALAAGMDGAWIACWALGVSTLALGTTAGIDCGRAVACWTTVLSETEMKEV